MRERKEERWCIGRDEKVSARKTTAKDAEKRIE